MMDEDLNEYNNSPPPNNSQPQPNYPQPPPNYQPQPNYPQPQYYQQPPFYMPPPSKSLAVASMVLGIVSVVLLCTVYLGIPCSIVGLVLGIVAKKKNQGGMATAGIVLSIISLALVAIIIIALVCIAIFVPTTANQFGNL